LQEPAHGMGSLSTARTFGGIGSLMVLLFIVPVAGTVLAVIGWILILVAVSNIAEVTGDRAILNDTIVAAILAIVGIIAGVVVIFGSLLRFTRDNGLSLFGGNSIGSLNGSSFTSGSLTGVGGLVVGALVGLAILWVFYLVSAVFLRRAFSKIAGRLNVKMFSTAALLYLIGAGLTIVGIGLVIVFIANILMVVAFFSMPDDTSLEPPPAPSLIPTPPPAVAPR
jgi:uncharacterized membrane protein